MASFFARPSSAASLTSDSEGLGAGAGEGSAPIKALETYVLKVQHLLLFSLAATAEIHRNARQQQLCGGSPDAAA